MHHKVSIHAKIQTHGFYRNAQSVISLDCIWIESFFVVRSAAPSDFFFAASKIFKEIFLMNGLLA